MEIKNIKIINFKGFKECDITFHPKINVFIGSNASGKTTLLTALLKSVYSITQHFAHPQVNSEVVTLKNDDVNYSARYCYIKTSIVKFPEYSNEIDTAIYINSLPDNLEDEKKLVERRKYEFINWFKKRVGKGPITVPIIKFYPSNRGNISYSENLHWDKYPISQLETWSNIYLNTVSYSKFFHWFFENETNELRLQRDHKDFNVQNPTLRNVRKALSKAFEHIGYRNIRIKTKQLQRAGSSKLTPNLVLENEETKQDEYIDYKSDGEKALITIVADIAYNLSLAKDFTNDDDFLTSPGIVIIDEIETHLHPNWQRQIIPILTSIFSNIQFFIATHSPQIVGSVNSDSVFICDDFNVHKVNMKTKGEDTNSLLKFIFNATERPKPYVELLEKFYTHMEENDEYTEMEKLIEQIRKIEEEDESASISNLIDEMNLQLEAYKFEREHEKNN